MSDERWIGLPALAPAFALGALDPEEEAGFRVILAGSPELQAEVSRYTEMATVLGVAGGDLDPPSELKGRLMAAVRHAAATHSAPDEEPVHGERGYARSLDIDSLEWTPHHLSSGFDIHWLRRNEASGESAVLLRGLPGATYPDHVHPGGEQFFVLHGSFADDGSAYAAGTSGAFPPGSVHRGLRVTGDDACIILVVTGAGGIRPLEPEMAG